MENLTIPELCTSEQTRRRLSQVIADLSDIQLRFVVARSQCLSDTEAAQVLGLSRDRVYHWPNQVKEAVRLMAADGVVVALEMRRRSLAEAMAVKTAGLRSKKELVRQKAATEIIEWELGKAASRHEHGSDPDRPVKVDVNISGLTNEELDSLAELARRVQSDHAGEGSQQL